MIFECIAADYLSDYASEDMPYGPGCPDEELDKTVQHIVYFPSPHRRRSIGSNGIKTDSDVQGMVFDCIVADYMSD